MYNYTGMEHTGGVGCVQDVKYIQKVWISSNTSWQVTKNSWTMYLGIVKLLFKCYWELFITIFAYYHTSLSQSRWKSSMLVLQPLSN